MLSNEPLSMAAITHDIDRQPNPFTIQSRELVFAFPENTHLQARGGNGGITWRWFQRKEGRMWGSSVKFAQERDNGGSRYQWCGPFRFCYHFLARMCLKWWLKYSCGTLIQGVSKTDLQWYSKCCSMTRAFFNSFISNQKYSESIS
jgi:hypothetical protein